MPAEQFRRDRINALADLKTGVGLEIGPLDRALALRSDHDVRYVDVVATEALRDHYRGDPAVVVDDIPDVDFALTDETGKISSLADAVASGGPYRWFIASHVIEHVPDMITWLQDIAQVAADGASVVLVIPDRRYTFDVRRPPTTVGQLLQAYDLKEKVPSVRAVYDHFRNVVVAPAPQLWAGDVPGPEARSFDFESTMLHTARVRENREYVDSHVWLFTPSEFVEQIVELGRMGLCDFVVERLVDTAENELEFYVVLRRVPRGLDAASEALLRAGGIQASPDSRRVAGAAPSPEEHVVAQAAVVPDAPATLPPSDGSVLISVSGKEVRLIQAKRSLARAARRLARTITSRSPRRS